MTDKEREQELLEKILEEVKLLNNRLSNLDKDMKDFRDDVKDFRSEFNGLRVYLKAGLRMLKRDLVRYMKR